MKNFISPSNHVESKFTGSTIESMVNKTKSLDVDYFSCTDHGSLNSILKTYQYCNKKKMKIIAGIEIFFRDDDCDIIRDTESAEIKYFKLLIHFKDQEAYQLLVKMISDTKRKAVIVNGEDHKLFDWNDLFEISHKNTSICTSDIEGMVSKHLLVNRPDLSVKYYDKLKDMFGDNFFPTLIPRIQDKYWNSIVELNLNGKLVTIPAGDRVETNIGSKHKAMELTYRNTKHKELRAVVVGGIRHVVSEQYREITKATLSKDFQDLPEDLQTKANKLIRALANKNGDTLLISGYSYYSNEDDFVVQNMKLGEELRIHQRQNIKSSEETVEYFHKEMNIDLFEIEKMVENSHKWASNFDDFELKYNIRFVDSGENPEQQMLDIIKKVGRMKWDDPKYVKQFREEFDLLTKNGISNLVPYFLPIVDVFAHYKENGQLVGPARGSAGGFLLSYLMGITQIDPIKYGLYSSRFLTQGRIEQGSLPDIDVDLENRSLLVGKDGNGGYLKEKYGKRAAQCSTRTLLRLKSAILDANRFVNKGKLDQEVQALSKSLPTTPMGISDADFVFGYDLDGSHEAGLLDLNKDLKEYSLDRPEEWNIVAKALSLGRQNSRHACAFVIADCDIEDVVSIIEVGGVKRVTGPEHKQCEGVAGLQKYDFLVVNSVLDSRVTMDYINKKNGDTDMETGYFTHNGVKTYIWDLPEDQAVFDMLGRGETETVFQLNTVSVTPVVKAVKPNRIIDCATVTSLVRPGPLGFVDKKTGRNMVEEYIERKFGRSVPDILILMELIPETYGVLVFQEQCTFIARELAGMNVEDSENLRIAMGKKKIKLLTSLKPVFLKGALRRVDQETADKIWDMLLAFSGYGFNKCLSGDSVLLRNRCGHRSLTIEEMYKSKNDKIWAKENGRKSVGEKYRRQGYGKGYSKKGDRLYPNNIVDIRFEGVREVYRITTESGKTIKSTDNHKYPTPNGDVLLMHLKIGDELYVNDLYEKLDTVYRYGGDSNVPKKGQMGFQKKPNSSLSKFKERSKKLKESNICSLCSEDLSEKRKEIHHIDNNHGNQDEGNLILTCSSCHKKEHYKMNRTKQGEKGLLCGTEKILKIELVGEENVYDVEMEHPHHNFVTETGIVTCNSHAVAYSVISYACAFMKHNYPLEWWAAILTNAPSKEINEVFYKYTKDMVLPPDVNLSTEDIIIDYDKGKLRNKLSMITGLGNKVANKIMENRPYADLNEFLAKKPCGPSLTKKLIHVGVLDSLFPTDFDLDQKMDDYESNVNLIAYNAKLLEYDERITSRTISGDEKGAIRAKKDKERYIEKGVKPSEIDPTYISLTPKRDFIMKKSVFPTINLDLEKALSKFSSVTITESGRFKTITNQHQRQTDIFPSELLQKIDENDVKQDIYFCTPAYIIDASEFTYKGGSQKALKLILDSSGYVSEKVLWPDYNTGELIYDPELKKGAVVWIFYSKKSGKPYTNINQVIIEEKSIL